MPKFLNSIDRLYGNYVGNLSGDLSYVFTRIQDGLDNLLFTDEQNEWYAYVLSGKDNGQTTGTGGDSWDAKIIPLEGSDERKVQIKVRRIGLDDVGLPSPAAAQGGSYDYKTLMDIHPWAISEDTLKQLTNKPSFGDIVKVKRDSTGNLTFTKPNGENGSIEFLKEHVKRIETRGLFNGASLMGDYSGNGDWSLASPSVKTAKPLVEFLDKLSAYLQDSGFNYPIVVTSMIRTPAQQASAMLTKINGGDKMVYEKGKGGLYNPTLMNQIFKAINATTEGAHVEDAVVPSPQLAKKGAAYGAMVSTLDEQVKRGSYISGHMRTDGGSGIDIRIREWPGFTDKNSPVIQQFMAGVKALGASPLYENIPYHIHITVK